MKAKIKNCIINNLKNDTNYDNRICSNLIMFMDYGPKLKLINQ